MAQIPIERKHTTAWPWVLAAALVVALLAWWLLAGRTPDRTAATTVPAVATGAVGGEVAALPEAVERYVSFAEAGPGTMDRSHDYTADGLRRLADALDALRDRAPADVDLAERARAIRERADAMQRDPTSSTHALQAREAFVLASSTLRQLRPTDAASPAREDDRIGAAHEAATAIDPQVPLLDQGARVERFFDASAAALRQIAG